MNREIIPRFPRVFVARNYHLPLGVRTLVMGIVNITPDSFSDGGEAYSPEAAVARVLSHIDNGADIIDIGGESTRPGSAPVTLDDELSRVIPVIEAIAPVISVPISIDTCKAEVARQALQAGAAIVNDISAGTFDPAMRSVVAEFHAGVILMHIKGTPRDMQQNPRYSDVVKEIAGYLQTACSDFVNAGVPEDHILVDPGIGFGKNLDHNLEIIRNLAEFAGIGAGVVFGPSRKSFIGLLTGKPVEQRLFGSIASFVSGALLGADVVRVHDVREAADALKVADALRFKQ